MRDTRRTSDGEAWMQLKRVNVQLKKLDSLPAQIPKRWGWLTS
jgi:hypothetical protein